MPTEAGFKQTLCADIDGFSLHAAVRGDADDRKALEQLCRTITRPARGLTLAQASRSGGSSPRGRVGWLRPRLSGTSRSTMIVWIGIDP